MWRAGGCDQGNRVQALSESLGLVSCVGSLACLVTAQPKGFLSGLLYADNIGGGYRPLH
jgi:hypothetical protein